MEKSIYDLINIDNFDNITEDYKLLKEIISNLETEKIPLLIKEIVKLLGEKELLDEIDFSQFEIYSVITELLKALDCMKFNKTYQTEIIESLEVVKEYIGREYNEDYGSDYLDIEIKCNTLRIILGPYILHPEEYKIPSPEIAILFIEEND